MTHLEVACLLLFSVTSTRLFPLDNSTWWRITIKTQLNRWRKSREYEIQQQEIPSAQENCGGASSFFEYSISFRRLAERRRICVVAKATVRQWWCSTDFNSDGFPESLRRRSLREKQTRSKIKVYWKTWRQNKTRRVETELCWFDPIGGFHSIDDAAQGERRCLLFFLFNFNEWFIYPNYLVLVSLSLNFDCFLLCRGRRAQERVFIAQKADNKVKSCSCCSSLTIGLLIVESSGCFLDL